MGYAGHDWIERSLKATCSELGKLAADVLGDAFLGIYHLNRTSLKKVDWNNEQQISVTFCGELATVDANELTRLVILCHDRMLRLSVQGAAPNYLRLVFHKRTVRKGGEFWQRCPKLDDHIQVIRDAYLP